MGGLVKASGRHYSLPSMPKMRMKRIPGTNPNLSTCEVVKMGRVGPYLGLRFFQTQGDERSLSNQ
jgi:hypothetical protein